MNSSIMGIPLWLIGAGIAAYFVLKRRGAVPTTQAAPPNYMPQGWEMYTTGPAGSGQISPASAVDPSYTPPVTQW